MKNRQKGVLLHVTSLPSKYGVGDLGPTAYRFVDLLKKNKQTHWQILPINPIEKGMKFSPYSSTSAFAGNLLFISPEGLFDEGLLEKKDLYLKSLPNKLRVDYLWAERYKTRILSTAYKNSLTKTDLRKKFLCFCEENQYWLLDYALFDVLSKKFKSPWMSWPQEFRNRNPEMLASFEIDNKARIEEAMFTQFIFFQQWEFLRKHCQSAGVKIVGDLPIYLQQNSSDVWGNTQFFQLDKKKEMEYVAGVPPDYFSKTGQAWGVPVYDWEALKKDNFSWWIKRFEWNLKIFDMLRVDHFRGFINYWRIKKGDSAVLGEWCDVPTGNFFSELKRSFRYLPLIAEDLGDMSREVQEKIHSLGFPGMKVLEFAFQTDLENDYLPHRYPERCVAYTGTHDNNTIRGWFKSEASAHELKNLFDYYGKTVSMNNVHKVCIELLVKSQAELVIVPMQDVLGLGAESRMNTPGTVRGNWVWRLKRLPSKL